MPPAVGRLQEKFGGGVGGKIATPKIATSIQLQGENNLFCNALRIAYTDIVRGCGNEQLVVGHRTKIPNVALNTVS